MYEKSPDCGRGSWFWENAVIEGRYGAVDIEKGVRLRRTGLGMADIVRTLAHIKVKKSGAALPITRYSLRECYL